MAIKSNHNGAKNGGGYWGTRSDAKAVSKRLRRIEDRLESVTDESCGECGRDESNPIHGAWIPEKRSPIEDWGWLGITPEDCHQYERRN
jgi:hypothetical protein